MGGGGFAEVATDQAQQSPPFGVQAFLSALLFPLPGPVEHRFGQHDAHLIQVVALG